MRLADALRLVHQQRAGGQRPFRVYLACGFLPLHLETFLHANLLVRLANRPVSVETGRYGDLAGNVERIGRGLPDAAVVVMEWSDLDPRLGLRSTLGWRTSQLTDILAGVSQRLEGIAALLNRVSERVCAAVALPSLPLPPCFQRPGVVGDPMAFQLREMVDRFAAQMAGEPMLRLLNPLRLDRCSPPGERLDLDAELRSGFPYGNRHASVLGELLSELVCPAAPKKGIITDLDDTLWRGVLGEDGMMGISWDLDHGSHVHALYQGMLASLAETGVLVAVASKNDPDLARQALDRPDLVVSPRSLFPVEVHWGRKSDSVRRILDAWNVGADSVVFIDDSPMELAEVASALPGIEGILFPTHDDQAVYGLLERLRDLFGKTCIGDEDALRAASIQASQQRKEDAASVDPEDFLARADARITLHYDQPDQRTLDLINKTNQFNLNGGRLDETQWKRFLEIPDRFLVAASYSDKYGSLGKIAAVAGRRLAAELSVDLWVMSCRAFSRRIEHGMLKALFEHFGAASVRFQFAETPRNAPLREFLTELLGDGWQGQPVLSRDRFLSLCPPLYAKVTAQ